MDGSFCVLIFFDYLCRRNKKAYVRMKKRLLALLPIILIVLSLALLLTKPEPVLHVTTLSNKVMNVVNHEMKYVDIPEEYATEGAFEAMNQVNTYIRGHIQVKDYVFFNVGVLYYRGNKYPISIGTMNQAFVLITDGQARKVFLRGWSAKRTQDMLKKLKKKASKLQK